MGDNGAMTKLLKGKYILKPKYLPSGKPSQQEIVVMETYLLDSLTKMSNIYDRLKPELDLYRATHRELDEQEDSVRTSIARSRLNFLIWTRAHRKMASGVKDPAKWFDIKDAPTILIKAGVRAL
jgi:hypothetical protein